MTQKASTQLKFMDAWTFPEVVEKRISNFVQKHKGLWLHAPVGISQLGKGIFDYGIEMITIDINKDVKPDIICDVFHLPFRRGTFDGVISDPLWYSKEKKKTIGLSYPDRRYLSYEIRDVLKSGGWWIFNGLWNPIVKGLSIKKIETPIQAYSSFRNVSLLVYLQRINEVLF